MATHKLFAAWFLSFCNGGNNGFRCDYGRLGGIACVQSDRNEKVTWKWCWLLFNPLLAIIIFFSCCLAILSFVSDLRLCYVDSWCEDVLLLDGTRSARRMHVASTIMSTLLCYYVMCYNFVFICVSAFLVVTAETSVLSFQNYDDILNRPCERCPLRLSAYPRHRSRSKHLSNVNCLDTGLRFDRPPMGLP